MVTGVLVYAKEVSQVAATYQKHFSRDVVVLHEDNMIPTKWPQGSALVSSSTVSGSDDEP